MTRKLDSVLSGILCCIQPAEPVCEGCPYQYVTDCKEEMGHDISYYCMTGKMKLGKDGVYQAADIPEVKVKTKRKNGLRYSDGVRRNGRYDEEFED